MQQIQTHTHTYTYPPPHTHIYTHTYIHTYIHTHTHAHIYTHTYTHVHTHIHTHTYTHTHTYIHTYSRAHTHKHTLTHKHTHTHFVTCVRVAEATCLLVCVSSIGLSRVHNKSLSKSHCCREGDESVLTVADDLATITDNELGRDIGVRHCGHAFRPGPSSVHRATPAATQQP